MLEIVGTSESLPVVSLLPGAGPLDFSCLDGCVTSHPWFASGYRCGYGVYFDVESADPGDIVYGVPVTSLCVIGSICRSTLGTNYREASDLFFWSVGACAGFLTALSLSWEGSPSGFGGAHIALWCDPLRGAWMLTNRLDGMSHAPCSSRFGWCSMKSIRPILFCNKTVPWVVCGTLIKAAIALCLMMRCVSSVICQTVLQVTSIVAEKLDIKRLSQGQIIPQKPTRIET